MSTLNNISLLGGTPGRSSEKSFGNSFTIKTDWKGGTSTLESLTQTNWLIQPFENKFFSLHYEMKQFFDIGELLTHSVIGSL